MTQVPANVVALADERAAAKQSRDFALADQLRSQIDEMGWRITDTPSGYALTPKPAFEIYTSIDALPELEVSTDVTIGIIVDGFIEDARTCIDAILARCSDVTVVAVVVGDEALQRENVIELHVATNPGWGRLARRIVEISPSPWHVLMDPSTIFDGDAITPMREVLVDGVVASGWKGALVDLEDQWRSVIDRGSGEVDVLLGYLMMVNRQALLATDTPHAKAVFYRNADLELSLALREAGGRLVALDLPVHQERHHGYHDSDPSMREKESRRTYDRILERFRGKDSILSPRR